MRYFLLLIFITYCCSMRAQIDSFPALAPYFSAIIVKDINQSIDWYSSILGLEVINHTQHEEMAFGQANLKGHGILLELIELGSAISPSEAIPDYSAKTKLIGIFKIGFQVIAFDRWVQHLREKKVNFRGEVVVDSLSGKRMLIILDPDGNRIQLFEG